MQLSRLTAYVIATRHEDGDVRVSSVGPHENGKFSGWIMLGPEDRYRPLISTEPVYGTAEEAVDAMNELIADVKRVVKEEVGDKHPIEHAIEWAKNEAEKELGEGSDAKAD